MHESGLSKLGNKEVLMKLRIGKLFKPVELLLALAVFITLLGFIHWTSGAWKALSIGIDFAPMAPSTAITLLLLCYLVLLSRLVVQGGKYRILFNIVRGIVLLHSISIIAARYFKLSVLHPDNIVGGGLQINGELIGTMSPVTAILVLLTLALISGHIARTDRSYLWRFTGLIFGILNAIFCITIVMSYSAGMPLFITMGLVPVAFFTALALFMINFAVIGLYGCRGWMLDIFSLPNSSVENRHKYINNSGTYTFIMLILIIAFGAQFFLKHAYKSIKESTINEIASISRLKTIQISQWLSDRKADAHAIQQNELVNTLAVRLINGENTFTRREQIGQWMANRNSHYKYASITLYSKSGEAIASHPTKPEDAKMSGLVEINEVISQKQIVFEDLHRQEGCDVPHITDVQMGLWIPIITAGGDVAGVWMIQLDPETYLYSILNNWPTTTKTGEVILVRKHGSAVEYLSSLREAPEAALNHKADINSYYALPEVMAVSGATGVVEALDYRQKPVLAVLDAVPDTPWYSVVKVDREEVYSALQTKVWYVWAFTIAMIAIAALGVGYWDNLREKKAIRDRLIGEAMMRGLFDNMTSGAAIYEVLNDGSSGDDYIIKSFNNAALKIEHMSLPEVVGKSLKTLRPKIDDYGLIPVFQKVFVTGEPAQYPAEIYQDEKYRSWYENNVFKLPTGEIVAIYSDVTDRKEAELALNAINENLEQRVAERTEQLQQANKELEAFSYSVSHDLRAPLRLIDGWSHVLQEECSTRLDAEGQKLISEIKNETKRMFILIDDLLSLSKLSRSEMKLQEVNLSQLAHCVADRIIAQDPKRKVELRIQDHMLAMCDEHLVEIALINLVGNAYKFTSTKEQAIIEIGISGNPGCEKYYVKDNGVGFNMEFADILFGTFKRLHKASEFPGTGIGLAIVKRIVSKHGGTVWAESEEGQGATFYFTLNEELLA